MIILNYKGSSVPSNVAMGDSDSHDQEFDSVTAPTTIASDQRADVSGPPALAGRIANGMAPRLPPFISKLLSMLSAPAVSKYCSWSPGGESIVIQFVDEFASTVLPKYFKHNNYNSFVRQLHIYGFRKEVEDGSGAQEFR